MGSIETFLPDPTKGPDPAKDAAAVEAGPDVLDGAAGIFGEILDTIGGFIAQATASLD